MDQVLNLLIERTREERFVELNRPHIGACGDLCGFLIHSPQGIPKDMTVRTVLKKVRLVLESTNLVVYCHSATGALGFWKLSLAKKPSKWSNPNKVWIAANGFQTPKIYFSDIWIVDQLLADLQTTLERLGFNTMENTAAMQSFRDLAVASLKH